MPPKLIDSKIFDQDTIKTKIASRIQQLKINEIANGEGSEEKERLKMSEHIFKKICKTSNQNPAKEAKNEVTEMKARYEQMQLQRRIMEEERAQVAGSNEGRIISDHANNMLSMIYKVDVSPDVVNLPFYSPYSIPGLQKVQATFSIPKMSFGLPRIGNVDVHSFRIDSSDLIKYKKKHM